MKSRLLTKRGLAVGLAFSMAVTSVAVPENAFGARNTLATKQQSIAEAALDAVKNPVASSTYGYYVENVNSGAKDNTRPSVGLLSNFRSLWEAGDSWGNGKAVNEKILNENMDKTYQIATSRTEAQGKAAYNDEFNDENYSITNGLEEYQKDLIEGLNIDTTADAWTEDWSPAADSALYAIADLMKLGRSDTSASNSAPKAYYAYPRPYRWDNEKNEFLLDGSVAKSILQSDIYTRKIEGKKDTEASAGSDGGFPSGHTNAAYISALTLAYAVPEKFDSLVMRAADLGNNRAVAGMHSVLDVMGGHMTGTANAAAALYNQKTDADSIAKKDSFQERIDAGYEAGAKLIGEEDAIKTANQDTYAEYQKNLATYTGYMTYGFEQIGATDVAMRVPKGAEALLRSRFPYLSDEEIRYVLYTTGLESGYPVLDDEEGWGRLNLYKAAGGYGSLVKDTIVDMDASKGRYAAKDNWMNDMDGAGSLTKKGTGELVLAGNNTYAGGTKVEGGKLIAASNSAFGTGAVANQAQISVTSGCAVSVASDYTQTADAVLTLNVASDKDVLQIQGKATLAGELVVNFVNGYVPAAGVKLVQAKEVAGKFDKITINGVNPQDIVYTQDGVTFGTAPVATAQTTTAPTSTASGSATTGSAVDISIYSETEKLTVAKKKATVVPGDKITVKCNAVKAADASSANDVTATSNNKNIKVKVSSSNKKLYIQAGKKAVMGTKSKVVVKSGSKKATIVVTVAKTAKVKAKKKATYTVSFPGITKKTAKNKIRIQNKSKKTVSATVTSVKKGVLNFKVKGLKKGNGKVMFQMGKKKVTVKVQVSK